MSTAAAERDVAPPFDDPAHRSRGYWSQAVRRLVKQPLTMAATGTLVALFAVGALSQQIAPQKWTSLDLSTRWQNHGPTLANSHLLGTDNIGRDVLVSTIWGLHNTEQAALIGALLAALLGLAVAGLAGFYGGWIDATLMRFVDLVSAFPAIVLMIGAFFFLQPLTVWKATIVFALYMWTQVARALRARIVTLSNTEFVEAARALGASDARLFFRHLLPNAAGTFTVAATSLVGQIILIEATAEFFGFGVPSLIRPTLGNLIADSTSSGIGIYNTLGLGWWVWAGPAATLVLILVCVNLVGDGLDTALNPRSK